MKINRRKLTKKQRENRRKTVVFLLLFLGVFFLGYFVGENGLNKDKWVQSIEQIESKIQSYFETEKAPNASSAEIHILDVGQGSSTLLQAEDGTTILIDTGRYNDGDKKILRHLDTYVGTGGTIDLLIFTHNDADHIGYGDRILTYYNVEEVWMNGVDTTTKVYEHVLDAIASSSAKYVEPKAGDVKNVGPFAIKVLNPQEGDTNNQNDQSIATKISINDFSIMNTGDVDMKIETEIMQRHHALQSDVLILGHHGSKYSSSQEWISKVEPELAVYSAGEGNSYDHPNDEIIERIIKNDIPFYGTDINGTISLFIDETGSYTIKVEKGGETYENGSGRN